MSWVRFQFGYNYWRIDIFCCLLGTYAFSYQQVGDCNSWACWNKFHDLVYNLTMLININIHIYIWYMCIIPSSYDFFVYCITRVWYEMLVFLFFFYLNCMHRSCYHASIKRKRKSTNTNQSKLFDASSPWIMCWILETREWKELMSGEPHPLEWTDPARAGRVRTHTWRGRRE